MASESSNFDLIVASEGSFFPAPVVSIRIHKCGDIVLYGFKKQSGNGSATEQSNETNFNGQAIKSVKELYVFCQNVGFPSHGLILRRSKNDIMGIVKGVNKQERTYVLLQLLYEYLW